MRLRRTFKVLEFAPNASPAIWVSGNLDGLKATAPNVAGDELVVHRLRVSAQELDGFGRLHGGDHAGNRVEDAGRVAGRFCAHGRGSFFALEQASEAGGFARADRHREAVAANRGRVNPRDAE